MFNDSGPIINKEKIHGRTKQTYFILLEDSMTRLSLKSSKSSLIMSSNMLLNYFEK